VKIKIGKGLKPFKGQNKTVEEIESLVTVPSPYTLAITNVASDHDGTEGTVRITTNQQLTGESISS
jgi:hypothetical protein